MLPHLRFLRRGWSLPAFQRKTPGRVRPTAKRVRKVDADNPVLMTEHEAQREFVKWFRKTLSGVRIFSIPNGGGRSKSQGARLKAEGVSRGVPDLFCPELYLWVEMKREKGGVVSSDQRDWLEYLESLGYAVMICRGLEDAKKQVLDFLTRGQLDG